MSIRTKIGMILLFAVAGFVVAQFSVQNYIVLPGFLSLEQDDAFKDLHRVEATLKNEIDQLDSICGDWAAWNDTYDFVGSYSNHYVESNLLFSSFADNHINLIYICDMNGRVIWGKSYDLNTQTPIEMPIFSADGLSKIHPLYPGKESMTSGKKGILMTDYGPMLVSEKPILKSNGEGPAKGVFIMGRFLNEPLTKAIAWQTQVDFSILPISTDHLDADTRAKLGRFSPESPYLIDYVNPDQLTIQSLYRDISGNPAFLIDLNVPRQIAHKGYETVRNSIYSILIVGLGVLLMVLLCLKWTILSPLSTLASHVLDIEQSGNFSKRLRMRRKDEIGILSKEFDDMLETIEKTSNKLADANVQLQKGMEIRMQAVSALKESEGRFRTLVEQAADAVFLNDRNGRIRMVNRLACDSLGYETLELLQMSVFDIDPDFLNRQERNQLCQQLDKQSPVVFEGMHRRKNGESFPVEVSLTPIQYGGEELVLSIARNISRRKQLELRLRYADKMDALRTLTAGIAHNFNNILTIIIGSTGLAKQMTAEDAPVYKLIHKIEKAGLRAREIVWQLINFSHPADDYLALLPIHQIIADLIDKLEKSAPEAIQLQKHIQPDCRPVLSNIVHIQQMVTNLWNNSIEALSDAGGTIDIRVENVSFNTIPPDASPELTPGNYVNIIISDTGRGIDPANLENIFDPYFTTKDFSNGAGMGLSIVQGIVKSNGGAITVTSQPEEGTKISIFLPAAETS